GGDWAATIAFPPQALAAEAVHRSWRAPEVVEIAEPLSPRPAIHGGPILSVPLGQTGLCLRVVRDAMFPFHRAELDKVARVTEIVVMMARVGETRTSTGTVA